MADELGPTYGTQQPSVANTMEEEGVVGEKEEVPRLDDRHPFHCGVFSLLLTPDSKSSESSVQTNLFVCGGRLPPRHLAGVFGPAGLPLAAVAP